MENLARTKGRSDPFLEVLGSSFHFNLADMAFRILGDQNLLAVVVFCFQITNKGFQARVDGAMIRRPRSFEKP